MDGGAWRYTVHGTAKSDTTEQLTLSLSKVYSEKTPHLSPYSADLFIVNRLLTVKGALEESLLKKQSASVMSH